jgi:tRNA-specific 2-thiouridylase
VPEAGPLLDVDGGRVGEHHGTPAYTIGQRQGLGVALGEPRYVSRIDPLTNTITLGRREDLETRMFTIERASFIARGGPRTSFRADVRIRHRATPMAATVSPLGDRRWEIATDVPVWAAAPGQAAVLYDGDVVLGGGRIARPADLRADGPAQPVEGAAGSVEGALVGSGAGALVGSGAGATP